MTKPKNEFVHLTVLKAEAIGEPGRRTFRIVADSDSGSAAMWLEKEQLLQLALGIHQLLALLSEGGKAEGSPSPTSVEAGGGTSLEFKVGKLILGHDGGSGLFLLDVHETEAEDEPPMVRVWSGRPQISAFADDALKVCAAGRPLCPLCGGPINPDGHSCPRVNGHHRLADVSDS